MPLSPARELIIDNRQSTIDNAPMRLLITAGPTREYIDSIRYLSNASSGKMGYAIAAAAARRGHQVVLISGPVELPEPSGVKVVRVVSAADMLKATLTHFRRCDAAVLAAAVADYRPVRRVKQKIKKKGGPLSLRLTPTVDIARRLGRIKKGRVLIGFALEDHHHRRNAEAKLRAKNLDAIVLNRVEVIGGEATRVEFLRAEAGWGPPQAGSKQRIAGRIVELVEMLALRKRAPS